MLDESFTDVDKEEWGVDLEHYEKDTEELQLAEHMELYQLVSVFYGEFFIGITREKGKDLSASVPLVRALCFQQPSTSFEEPQHLEN